MNFVHSRLNRFPAQGTISIREDYDSSREWLIPLKWNVWVQLALVLFFAGATSTVLSLVLTIKVLLLLAIYALVIAILIFVSTLFGRDTIRVYRRVRNHIRQYGKFDERLQNKLASQMYCRRAGARAAARDMGIYDELIPELTNPWRLF